MPSPKTTGGPVSGPKSLAVGEAGPERFARVFPSPALPPLSYLPGIGANGALLPIERARALEAAGLVVIEKPPDEKPVKKESD